MTTAFPARPHSRLSAWASLCGVLFASSAWAAPGEHIVVGATTITPEVSVGVEGRSNAFLAGAGDVPARGQPDAIIPAFNFYLSPALGLDLKTEKVRWTFDGRYLMRKFFSEAASRLDQFSDFHVKTQLEALPRSVFGFAISEDARLLNRPTDEEASPNSLNTQFRNDLGLDLKFRPGPEFDIVPGGSWSYHDYRIPGPTQQIAFNHRNAYEPRLGIAWRFFPNTAFVVDAAYTFNRWDRNVVPTGETTLPPDPDAGLDGRLGQFLALPDSEFFKATTGIRGRVGRNLVIVLTAGWGFGHYDADSVTDEENGAADGDPETVGFAANVSPTDGILVNARLAGDFGYDNRQKFGQKVTFQYRKDFQDSFFTNYVHQHALMAALDSRIGKFVSTRLEGSVRFETYRGEVERNDIYAKVDAAVNLLPTRYLTFQLGAFWARRQSSDIFVDYDNVQGRFVTTFIY